MGQPADDPFVVELRALLELIQQLLPLLHEMLVTVVKLLALVSPTVK